MCAFQLQRLSGVAVALGLSFSPGEHAALAQVPARTWRVDPTSLVAIGGADGTGPTEFSRILGLGRLRNGIIAVADEGASELRLFDSTGRFIEIAARKGSGPGELMGVDRGFVGEDTITVLDGYGWLHTFGPTGAYVRRSRLRELVMTEGPYLGWPAGLLPDGRPVTLRFSRVDNHRLSQSDSMEIVVVAADAKGSTSLGARPGLRSFQGAQDRFRRTLGFSPTLEARVVGREICSGFTERYDILCTDDAGKPTRHITQAVESAPVTTRMRAAMAYDVSGRLPGGGSRYEGSLRAHRENEARTLQFMKRLPVFARMVGSHTGELWVSDYRAEDGFRRYARAAPNIPSRWRVFDARGQLTGIIQLPPSFYLRDAGRDWVLGVSFDDDDVESVTMLRIVR